MDPSAVAAQVRQAQQRAQEGPYGQGNYTQARPAADPQFQAALDGLNFHHTTQLVQGVITDVAVIANCYRVQLEKMRSPITATLGTFSTHGATGVCDLTTLPVGTWVIVAVHPASYYGIIIGTMPFPRRASNQGLAEQLFHTSRSRVDEAHKKPLKLGGGHGSVTDWSERRPFDATSAGETGWIAETGMRIFMDPFIAMLGLDEATSITAFWHDQLLRIAAYNLRMFTAGYEREGLDDGNEYNDWSGYTPYPWEQLGLFERGDPRKENSPESWQGTEPAYGPWEPQEDDTRAWHRETHYHGYLGQGGKRTLCTRPAEGERARFGTSQLFPGLFDETVLLDGRYLLASAKGISIAKRPAIIVPQRKALPEQPGENADSEQNYKFSGQAGEGPDHEIASSLEVEGDNKELTRAAGLLDLHAYLFNYAAFHGHWWHGRDWQCPEQSELEYLGGIAYDVPEFTTLAGSMFLEAPEAKQVKIDHRYEDVDIWPNQCGIDFLEDGGVVLYDGFGSEIRMTAGSVTISAPGDVWLKSGRTANIWGGDDVVIRAKASCDISASEHDVRIKAEQNMQLLSGNGGKGGTLLESKGARAFEFEGKTGEDVVSGGIMLRATQADVAAWGAAVYLRTGGDSISPGPIVLDCAKGTAPLVTHAATQQHYVGGQFYLHYGVNGEIRKSAMLSESYNAFPGSFFADGYGAFAKTVVVDGSVLCTSGHIATSQASGNPYVSSVKNASQAAANVRQGQNLVSTDLPQGTGKPQYTDVLKTAFYDAQKAGNDSVIKFAAFEFRDKTQYGTEGFRLFEDRWQLQSRLAQQETAMWAEKRVSSQNGDTFPYPGREFYEGGDSGEAAYFQLSADLVNLAEKQDKPRASGGGDDRSLADAYKTPTIKEGTAKPLLYYTVIR